MRNAQSMKIAPKLLVTIFLATLITSVLSARARGEGSRTALLLIGYSEAHVGDFFGSRYYQKRVRDASGFLAVSADFNGDGQVDEARVLRNAKKGDTYVVATVISKDNVDTYVIKMLPFAKAENLGIKVAMPSKAGSSAYGLTIFTLDGATPETYDWAAENFVFRAKV